MVLCWFDVITVIKRIHYAPLMFHTRAPVLNIDGSVPEFDVYTVYWGENCCYHCCCMTTQLHSSLSCIDINLNIQLTWNIVVFWYKNLMQREGIIPFIMHEPAFPLESWQCGPGLQRKSTDPARLSALGIKEWNIATQSSQLDLRAALAKQILSLLDLLFSVFVRQ